MGGTGPQQPAIAQAGLAVVRRGPEGILLDLGVVACGSQNLDDHLTAGSGSSEGDRPELDLLVLAGVEQVHEQLLRALGGLAVCSYGDVPPVVEIATVGDLHRLPTRPAVEPAHTAVAVQHAEAISLAKAGDDPEDIAHLLASCVLARHDVVVKQKGLDTIGKEVVQLLGRHPGCHRVVIDPALPLAEDGLTLLGVQHLNLRFSCS
ncbi:hypothetical protein [Spirillospora sp. CA-128828]|uniref:hypothetical protein n=1 Tax=Spirillospora sp. CA-128828 TaxID=3240033 RepID=UPI003D915463